ncbi:MAG: hypothetical protein Q8Q09_10135 [Deltaproteobacteria bacterium]|nr:hypothetical protein [Deltaproteobacteria bacterium]
MRATLGGLEATVVETQPGVRGPVVVLLHGFGAPGTDLVSFARALDVPRGTRFVFPMAPIKLPEFGPMADARAWWRIDMMRLQQDMMTGRFDRLMREVPDGLVPARAKMIALLDDVQSALGVTADKIILGGFSQGAMLSCDVALHSGLPLAGLVLLSGTLVAESVWRPLLPARKGLAVFQSHGQMDPILPYAAAELLRDMLVEAELNVSFESFRGGHEIPGSVLEALSRFVHKRLA